MVRRQWFAASAALVLAVALSNAALGAAGAAVSSSGAVSTVTFTGKIACKTMSGGVVKFNPTLTSNGTSKEVATIKGTASGCTGNITQHGLTIKNGHITASVNLLNNSCGGLASGPQGAIATRVKWTDTLGSSTAITPSKLSFSNAALGVNTKNQAVITLPGTGGKVTGTGSFAPSPTATTGTGLGVHSNATVTTLLATCNSATGLSSAKFGGTAIPTICAKLLVFFCIRE